MVWALVTCMPPPSNLNGQYSELCKNEGEEAGKKKAKGNISIAILSLLSTPLRLLFFSFKLQRTTKN